MQLFFYYFYSLHDPFTCLKIRRLEPHRGPVPPKRAQRPAACANCTRRRTKTKFAAAQNFSPFFFFSPVFEKSHDKTTTGRDARFKITSEKGGTFGQARLDRNLRNTPGPVRTNVRRRCFSAFQQTPTRREARRRGRSGGGGFQSVQNYYEDARREEFERKTEIDTRAQQTRGGRRISERALESRQHSAGRTSRPTTQSCSSSSSTCVGRTRRTFSPPKQDNTPLQVTATRAAPSRFETFAQTNGKTSGEKQRLQIHPVSPPAVIFVIRTASV